MIRDLIKYNSFENNFISSIGINVDKNTKLFNEMYDLAIKFGVLNLNLFNETTNVKVKIATILNSVSKTNKKNCKWT